MSTNVVAGLVPAPLDDSLTANDPVVIETVVPIGLLFPASVTVMDVVFTAKLTTPGELTNVYVAMLVL